MPSADRTRPPRATCLASPWIPPPKHAIKQLTINPIIQFLPGQWLDVFVPGITKPGGFTITSPPSKARLPSPGAPTADEPPYLELAIQKSPENVVANWLWQPVPAILNAEIWIRVGGSFVWPPPGLVPTVRVGSTSPSPLLPLPFLHSPPHNHPNVS